MKVLLVNKYHYVRGGSETYYFGFAELLRKAGHEVIFFAMQDKKNLPCEQSEYFVSNVDFNGELSIREKVHAAVRMIYSLEAKKKISALIEKEAPDIIHINLFHRVLTASIVDAAKKYHIPVVLTMHDLNCFCPNHTMLDHGKICEACLHGNYLNCVKRVCFKDSRAKCLMAAFESEYNKLSGLYNKIDLYITPSEFYRKKMIESGLTRNKVLCLRNFLPEKMVETERSAGGSYYLYFGRLSEEKGVTTLLKAVQNVPEIRLEIAGTGPMEQELQNYVHNRNLEDRIHFNGFLSGKALTDLVAGAKCIVLPSEWYENGPYSIMEAMAAGKPVIVSSEGGLPEIVQDGENGYICEAFKPKSLAECLRKMEKLDTKQYDQLSVTAKRMAKDMFEPSKYAERLLEEYTELLKKGEKFADSNINMV